MKDYAERLNSICDMLEEFFEDFEHDHLADLLFTDDDYTKRAYHLYRSLNLAMSAVEVACVTLDLYMEGIKK